MSTPEQHVPPVHACVAGAVAHGHAGGTLEPAVLLHTEVPPGLGVELDDGTVPRVDISTDGPGTSTLTVRVLAGAQSVSWQLPIAPFVAALPGQLGDDGRMVLLAVVDGEPAPAFWAAAVDCEDLAAELALPVADLAEALEGRLISWLSADLEELLHLDAHDRASAVSPAQLLADAVLAHYRGDLSASQEAARVAQALQVLDPVDSTELAGRLAAALAGAITGSDERGRAAVREGLGPFENEALRLLEELPALLTGLSPRDREDLTLSALVAATDRDEAVRGAVALVAALAREGAGPELTPAALLAHLGMVDDQGLARLARLWAALAVLAQQPVAEDAASGRSIRLALDEEGEPGRQWLRATAALVAEVAVDVAGRQRDRLAAHLDAVDRLLQQRGGDHDPQVVEGAVRALLALARYARQKAGVGPGAWVVGSTRTAVRAAGESFAAGAAADGVPAVEPEVAADLLVELLEDDVQGPDLIDGFLCAACLLLADVDPHADPVLRDAQVRGLLAEAPPGARGTRWLVDLLLREASDHDPMAVDLRSWLPGEPAEDPDRVAQRAGRAGVARAGLLSLRALADAFGGEAQRTRLEVLGGLLASGLDNHELLRPRHA